MEEAAEGGRQGANLIGEGAVAATAAEFLNGELEEAGEARVALCDEQRRLAALKSLAVGGEAPVDEGAAVALVELAEHERRWRSLAAARCQGVQHPPTRRRRRFLGGVGRRRLRRRLGGGIARPTDARADRFAVGGAAASAPTAGSPRIPRARWWTSQSRRRGRRACAPSMMATTRTPSAHAAATVARHAATAASTPPSAAAAAPSTAGAGSSAAAASVRVQR